MALGANRCPPRLKRGPLGCRACLHTAGSTRGQEPCSVGRVALSTKTPSNILKEFLLSFL